MGRIVFLRISTGKGSPKISPDEVSFVEGFGIEGDAHFGKGQRQVSFLGIETIERMKMLGIKGLCIQKFSENVTTEGVSISDFPAGSRLRVGESVHEVTQAGKECHIGCEIFESIGECPLPTGCMFTRVIKSGRASIGDYVGSITDKSS
jgi:MOSC domain-containing protein YiiM